MYVFVLKLLFDANNNVSVNINMSINIKAATQS